MIFVRWRYLCVIAVMVMCVYPDAILASSKYKEKNEGKWNVSLTLREMNVTDECKQGLAALDLDSFVTRVTLDTGDTDMNLLRDVLASFEKGEVICKFRVSKRNCLTDSLRVHHCSCTTSEPSKYDLIVRDTLRKANLKVGQKALKSISLVARSTKNHLPSIIRVVDLSNVSFSPTPKFSLKVDGALVSLDRCVKTYRMGSMHTFNFCTKDLHMPKIRLKLQRGKRETRQRACVFMDMYVRQRHAHLKITYKDACGRAGTYSCKITGREDDRDALSTSFQRLRGSVMPEKEKHIELEKDHAIFMFLTATGVCLVIIAAVCFFSYSIYILRDSGKQRSTLTLPDLKI